MDNQYFNCERLVLLYGTNPKMGTKPEQYSHFWFDVIDNRSELNNRELYKFIRSCFKKAKNETEMA